MPKRNPRVILYGHFGSGNIGNDSSLEAALYHIKKYRPEVDILCVCNGPQQVSERYGIKAQPIRPAHGYQADPSRNRLISLMKKAWVRGISETSFWLTNPSSFTRGDLFIIVGTGAVDDMAVRRPWNAPYELYRWCQTAKIGGAKVLFLSVGVGPIQNPISRFLMLRALRMADYRSYRDLAAFEYLRGAGFDSSGDVLYPDLVFSLPINSPARKETISSFPKVVGLGLINYYGWRHDAQLGEPIFQNYISKIKHFVAWLLNKGYVIRMIYGDAIDQRPVQEVIGFVNEAGNDLWQNKMIVEKIETVDDLFHQLAQTDIVIASRFHNVLCSLMLGLPVVSLGYHEKNVVLMKEMGLEAYCQHIEELSVEKLIEQFNSIISDEVRVIPRIQQQCEQYRQLLDEQYRTIFSPAAAQSTIRKMSDPMR